MSAFNIKKVKLQGKTVIKSQSKHFLERVFGTKEDPTHGSVKREGVSLGDIKDALLNGKIRVTHGGSSVRYTGENCDVTVNPITGNLIQANPA